MEKQFYVYIITNKKGGTLYIGVTSDIIKHTYEHNSGITEGFSKKYNLHSLVYYEIHESAELTIHREKRLKEWQRQWKIDLIETVNPERIYLYPELIGKRSRDQVAG